MSVQLRKKILKNGRTSFYLDIYSKGERHYEFLNLFLEPDHRKKEIILKNKQKVEEAKSICQARQNEIVTDTYKYVPKPKSKVNFFDFLKSYYSTIKKPNTQFLYIMSPLKFLCKVFDRITFSAFSNFSQSWFFLIKH